MVPGIGTIHGFCASNQASAILSRCRLLPLCDLAEQIDQRLIRLHRLRREARKGAAEVGAIEGRLLVNLPREKAPAERAVRNKADAEFLQRRNHFLQAFASTTSIRSGER